MLYILPGWAAGLFIESESFREKGGWALDQQFMDQMGSPYLLAHGMGRPVEDAQTTIDVPDEGIYYIFVRTFNWTSPWFSGKGPGKFYLKINGKRTTKDALGCQGSCWEWQSAGKTMLKKGQATLALCDLTGFDGRCDAIYLTNDPEDIPPSEVPWPLSGERPWACRNLLPGPGTMTLWSSAAELPECAPPSPRQGSAARSPS